MINDQDALYGNDMGWIGNGLTLAEDETWT